MAYEIIPIIPYIIQPTGLLMRRFSDSKQIISSRKNACLKVPFAAGGGAAKYLNLGILDRGPPPRIPVANKGLGWDSVLYMY